MRVSAVDLTVAGGVAAAVTYVLVRFWLVIVKVSVAAVVFLAVLGAVTLVAALTTDHSSAGSAVTVGCNGR